MDSTGLALHEYVVSFALIILLKIVCFILGYMVVRLGYLLILSGVKGEFKFSGNIAGFKADLVSVSPGLLFVLLGVALIGYAIYVEKGVNLQVTEQQPTMRPEVRIPTNSPFDTLQGTQTK